MTDTLNKASGNLWTIIAVLIFIILIIVGYKYKASIEPDIAAIAALDKSCDLRKGSCRSELPQGGKLTFSINPNNIPVLKPLVLNVTIEGVSVSKVEVDFVGVDMDMGYNRSTMDKIDNRHFTGTAVIPVCVRSRMDWKASVLLSTDHGLIMAPFTFYTI